MTEDLPNLEGLQLLDKLIHHGLVTPDITDLGFDLVTTWLYGINGLEGAEDNDEKFSQLVRERFDWLRTLRMRVAVEETLADQSDDGYCEYECLHELVPFINHHIYTDKEIVFLIASWMPRADRIINGANAAAAEREATNN